MKHDRIMPITIGRSCADMLIPLVFPLTIFPTWAAHAALLRAVASGEVSPEEAEPP
jgi:hypothetical protein